MRHNYLNAESMQSGNDSGLYDLDYSTLFDRYRTMAMSEPSCPVQQTFQQDHSEQKTEVPIGFSLLQSKALNFRRPDVDMKVRATEAIGQGFCWD